MHSCNHKRRRGVAGEMQPPSVEQKFALFSMLFRKNDEELGNKANSWNRVDIVGIVQYLIFSVCLRF